MERNNEIRETLKKHRLYIYELAAAVGISEPTITRWLRTPLTDEHYNRLSEGLEKLKGAAADAH